MMLTLVATLTLTLPAAPQPEGPLRPVEAGVADVGPLSTSLREFRHDLRVPTGFADVYELSPATGLDGFARASGAITAIFPRSIYIPTREGVLVGVPPGTVFHIGPLPTTGAAPTPTPSAPRGSIDRHAASTQVQRELLAERPGAGVVDRIERERAPRGSIFTSERDRRRRVAELMARAVGA